MLNMNESTVQEINIPNEYHGQRIDVVLAQLFPDFSRSQLSCWLKDGSITLNQRQWKPKEKVLGNEHLVFHVTPTVHNSEWQAENIPLTILFEDEHVLIVNKPTGLIVHPGAGNPEHTLVNALLFHAPSLQHLPRAGIVHRLDKDTTGLLIVAKTLTAHTNLIRQMQAREIQRRYLALVHGHVIAGGTINTFYGRHPRNRLKMAVCTQGREAITQYAVRTHYQYFTLLDVKLMTGRTHQIRVHMAHINHPVIGDQLYNNRPHCPAGFNDELKQAFQQFKRQALHACSLSFIHPQTQEELTFTAPLPDDFQSLLHLLDTDLV